MNKVIKKEEYGDTGVTYYSDGFVTVTYFPEEVDVDIDNDVILKIAESIGKERKK